jgi:hypothetical protein
MKTTRSRRFLARATTVGAIVALLVSGALAAHEGHQHKAMGTVKAIASASLDIETTEGKALSFVLSETTTFKRGDEVAKREDVAIGARVVVRYETKDGANQALEVKFGEKK